MSPEKAVDATHLSHHLSDAARARNVSPLKGLARYWGRPGLISLAGGMPHPDYFPFSDVSAAALVPQSFSVDQAPSPSALSWFWRLFGASSDKERTTPITIPKYPVNKDDINLAAALQYGTAGGIPQLQTIVTEFSRKVYQPAYSNFTTLAHTGNTDGWSRAVQALCNPGEFILTEDWTYPSALAASFPLDVRPVPIAMDKEGMRSDDLRHVLSKWDEEARGAKRPHVMYTIPIGQNPSGATMGISRKKEIYDICVEYDIVIVEDDPYYFLQEGEYRPKLERSQRPAVKHDPMEYLASLEPSYLRIDYQGRVIRLDTFSKTIAPGSRLGWFTCNPMFAERLERFGETSTQAPCGFTQSLIAQLLTTWKFEGYVRWLHGLGTQYQARRDYFVDCIFDEFHVREAIGTRGIWKGCQVYEAFAKPQLSMAMSEKRARGPKMFSFVPPTSGMFVWLTLHLEEHPSFKEGDEETLEMQLWTKLAEAGVLVAPGWFFAAKSELAPDKDQGHFRISFSSAESQELHKAITILGKTMREFFEQSIY